MDKKVLSVMLLVLGIVFSSQFATVEASPIRGYGFTYETYHKFSGSDKITIRQHFFVENISSSSIFLGFDNFVLRKSGHNTVEANSNSGGFSKRIKEPIVYTERYCDIYPGDKIAVSLDFDTEDTVATGWSLYFQMGGRLYPLATI